MAFQYQKGTGEWKGEAKGLGIGGVGTQGCCLVQVLPWQNGSMYFARANIQHFA